MINSIFLLQMSGMAGSGKSTLAKAISEETGAIIIDNDVIKSAILELSIEEISNDITRKLTYNINFSLARYYLEQNKSVIIDTPCRFPFIIERGERISSECNAKYKYIECYISEYEETKKRLRERTRLISQVSEMDVEEENYSKWLNQSIYPSTDYLTVETNKPIGKYLEDCIQYLRK